MTNTPTLRHLGGPTIVLDWSGIRIVSDPTLDGPGDYPIGQRKLVKTAAPTVAADRLGTVDLVVLSHDQHPDNLDRTGRALLAEVRTVLSTPEAAGRIAGVRGLEPWERLGVQTPDGELVVTAVPARHGPPGCEPKTGTVTGFHLRAADGTTVYLSGDNAEPAVAAELRERLGPVDVAVLHLGAATTALLPEPLTMNAAQGIEVARTLGEALIMLVHTEGWEHFTQGPEETRAEFVAAGLGDRLWTG